MTASASSGPTLVKTIFPGGGSADLGNFIRLSSSTALFQANDGTHGIELWKTDGDGRRHLAW